MPTRFNRIIASVQGTRLQGTKLTTLAYCP